LPLAFSIQTLWRPFCWAVIFGLAGSMVMTLLVLPALSSIVAGRGAVSRARVDAAPHELAGAA
jgi:Cu/Ag efflux pump CusA